MGKQQVLMQLGQYCNTTECYKCPVYEIWKSSGSFNNSCVECLRFPNVAREVLKAIEGDYEE